MNSLDQPRDHTHSLPLLHRAGQTSLQDKPLAEILDDLTNLTLEIIALDKEDDAHFFTYIALKEEDNLAFRAASPSRILAILLERYGELSPSRGVAGQAARHGETQLVQDVTTDEHYQTLDERIRSQVSIPIIVRGDVIGVLSVEHSVVNFFTPQLLHNLELMAMIIGSAVDSAHTRHALHIERERREQKLATQTIRLKLTEFTDKLQSEKIETERAQKLQAITLSVIKTFSRFSDLSDASQPLQSFWRVLSDVLPDICASVGAEVGLVLQQINNRSAFQIECQFPLNYSSEDTFYTLNRKEWDKLMTLSGGLYHTTIQDFNETYSARLPFQDWGFVDAETTEIAVVLIDGHNEGARLVLILANNKFQEDPNVDLWFEQQIDIFNLIVLRLREIYTATLQSETQLKYEKDRQQFIQDVMHQLVGPLGGLKADAEALLLNIVPEEEYPETLKRLVEQASLFQGYAKTFSLAAQSTDILHISARTFETFTSARLVELLIRLTGSFHGQAVFDRIDGPRVIEETFEHFPDIALNEEFFGILMLNLYDNAVKYSFTDADAPITVEGKANRWAVEIMVTNHGVEIKPKDAKRIFDRYARAEAAQEFAPVGTGIGLYLCDKIMKLHGGSITVEPSVPSKIVEGAHKVTFKLRLPIGGTKPE